MGDIKQSKGEQNSLPLFRRLLLLLGEREEVVGNGGAERMTWQLPAISGDSLSHCLSLTKGERREARDTHTASNPKQTANHNVTRPPNNLGTERRASGFGLYDPKPVVGRYAFCFGENMMASGRVLSQEVGEVRK